MLGEGTYTLTLRDGSGNLVTSGIRLYCSKWVNGSNTVLFNETSGRRTFAWDGEGNLQGTLQIPRNIIVSEITVYPQLELGSTATPYVPYVGSTTAIPLQGHALRSLPDGTHDELRVDADGNVTLVQKVGEWDFTPSNFTITSDNRYNYWKSLSPAANMSGNYANTRSDVYGSTSNISGTQPANTIRVASDGTTVWLGVGTTLTSGKLLYPLATPVETPLGTVTLPSMPAPDLTAWASCTPATDIELDYERSVTIAVERLEAAIAELATN